jgi:hypothetical protein
MYVDLVEFTILEKSRVVVELLKCINLEFTKIDQASTNFIVVVILKNCQKF